MTDAGFVYKRDEQLMNARRMVARVQEAMEAWDFSGVKAGVDLLDRQLRFMQTHETAESLTDIAIQAFRET
jgi:hypothetical protein